ncbi:MAG: efflux RND transporter permease subunit, partial [Desulfovibrionales bacterium]
MIWNFAIRRPVLTVVVFLILTIFGIYGYYRMPLRENPDVEFPVVSVNVVLPGAEPEVVETEIIEPLEEQINTVEGLKKLTSTAREQVGIVTAEFELWRDQDIAAQDVRDRVSRARRELPDGVDEPIVRKLDPDARAIMWIALTGGDRWDAVELSQYADETIKPRLESIRGVGQIMIGGEKRYAVRVVLDPEKLAAYRVSVQEVVETIQRNNIDIPSGRIESRAMEFLVKTKGQFSSPGPINDLIITSVDNAPVRIGDVGRAVAGVEDERQLARFTGETTIGLGVIKQSEANTVAVAQSVRERIEQLSGDFPPDMSYTIATDDAVYIRESIRDLLYTIGIATVLVVLVVFGFLRNGWGTLITGLAIPASLFGGMAVMSVLGFSVNTLTMLGLILAIGIVIDDAIVVLESSFRHLEQGAESGPAARVGTTEVAFPAVANTLSLAAVFIPVAFTAGIIGRFFFEFGLTVAVTVFASTFTALTLTPMLCSKFLRPPRHGRISRMLETGLERAERGYAWLLARAFKHWLLTVCIAVVALGLGLFLATQLSTEFMPSADRSQFMISFEVPEGSTLARTDAYARRIEEVLQETEQVRHFFLAIGLSRGAGPGKVNEGISFVQLVPRDEREMHQSEIVQHLREVLARIPGGRSYLIEEMGALAQGAPLQVVLQHPDLSALAGKQDELMAWMREQPQFVGVNSDLTMNKPQVEVAINRDKASLLGISVTDISNAMRFLLGEP